MLRRLGTWVPSLSSTAWEQDFFLRGKGSAALSWKPERNECMWKCGQMWRIPCMLEQKDPLSKMNLYLPFGSLTGISNIIDPNRSLGSHFFPQTCFFSSLPLLSKCDPLLRSECRNTSFQLISFLSDPIHSWPSLSPLISTPYTFLYFCCFLLGLNAHLFSPRLLQ